MAVLLAWFPVLILGLLATVDAFGLGGDFAVVAWASGLLMIGLTLVAGLSDLRAAEARTGAALGRAVAAETAERGRADELAAILLASESLTLMNEGKLDFTGILAALTFYQYRNPRAVMLIALIGFVYATLRYLGML